MDLNETTEEVLNRHPWELSRTQCLLSVFSKYIMRLHSDGNGKKYVNIGAGDLYFDRALLKKYAEDAVYAVDLAYKDTEAEDSKIYRHHYLEEISEKDFDYAIMMDSLEYMEDDADYIRKVTAKMVKGGYFFFTLPAYPMLFSAHDVQVGNKRRYSRKSFHEVIGRVSGLEIEEEYNFYSSLFMVRFIQKFLRLPIDPNHHVTAHWEHSEGGLFTKFVAGCLSFDFAVNRLFSKVGIRLPGLSMLVVCRKIAD